MNLQHVDTADKAKWYEIRRNELLNLLEQTSGIKIEIPEKYARELEGIRKKCLENQFEIVLVGEFQGGKSTTFNALCDGRDLSPRGLGGGGIKTSAAVISAQNISDNEKKDGLDEWAEITFKTKYEIQKSMFELLHSDLTDDKAFKNSLKLTHDDFIARMSDPSEFARLLDLDSPVHRKAVKSILSQYWAAWSQDKASLDEETRDRLRIATLQERFYGTPEYKQMLSKTVLGLDEFQPMVAFPERWVKRWQNGMETSFTWEEAAFVFIARVLLRIKSESLAKLGCRITDCPGLFANAYDTAVACGAINTADAVWYLIGGEKQIGAKELESLDKINKMGMIPKVIGSVNLRQKKEPVFSATMDELLDHGFAFPVLPYNARLAFLARVGSRISHGDSFSDYEQYCMRKDYSDEETQESMEQMWIEMVKIVGCKTSSKDLMSMESFSGESIQKVLDGSHIEEILSFLNEEIVTKKSQSILIDKGSKMAADVLQEYESKLKMSEDAVLQDKEVWEKKVQENQKALERFVEKSDYIIEHSTLYCEKESMSQDLAEALAKSALNGDFINQVAGVIAKVILEEEKHFHSLPKKFQECVMNKAMPEINSLFMSSLLRSLESWKTDSYSISFSNRKKDYTASFAVNDFNSKGMHRSKWSALEKRLDTISRDIKKLWEETSEYQDYIKNLQLVLPTQEALSDDLKQIQNTLFDNEKLRETIEDHRFGWGTLLHLIPKYIYNTLVSLIKKQDKLSRQVQLQNEIAKSIAPDLKSDDLRDMVSERFIPVFDRLQDSCIEKIRKGVKDLLVCFKADHVDPAKRSLNESERKRKEVAEKNRKIRQTQIEPLRKDIRSFEQQVTAELNQK